MKAKTLLLLLVVASGAGFAGWQAAHYADRTVLSGAAGATAGRKVLFYQSPMHPWIKSDKPGKCTICGMDLTPVYEGDAAIPVEGGLVVLPPSSVTVLDVRSLPASKGELMRSLRFAGTIEDDDTRRRVLSSYVRGRIDKLYVNFVGAEVTEGQPLADLYSPELLTAEREYVQLLRGQGMPQPLVESARQKLVRMGLTTQQISELPGKPESANSSQIVAPLSGTVIARKVYEGQYVDEGAALFEIADFSKMWFVFRAYEQDLPYLNVGLPIEVTTPSLPGKIYKAAITFIDPNLDDPTRSVKVRVELENPVVGQGPAAKRELLRKLYAEGVVQVRVPDVLLVARTAVLSPSGNPVVYVDKGGGAYEQRHVALGRQGDDAWEVTRGLDTGEKVVVAGNLMIDAQAQLNQGITTSHDHSPASAGSATLALNHQQHTVLSEFLKASDAARSALASDDLTGYNRAAKEVEREVDPLREVLRQLPWKIESASLTNKNQFEDKPSLPKAREAFLPLSQFLVELAGRLRQADAAFRDLKIYECPMTDSAFPGAPRKSAWMQLSPPLRNPWFGEEMLECGQEVRP